MSTTLPRLRQETTSTTTCPGDRGGPRPDRDVQRPGQQAARDRSHRPGDVHQLRWASLSFVIFCLALVKSGYSAPRGKNMNIFLSTLLIDRQENATWRATIRATRRYLLTNKRTFLRSRMTMWWYLWWWWNCFFLLQKNQLGNPYWHNDVKSQIQWTVGTRCVKNAI